MVDLESQYLKIKTEIDDALIRCVESSNYINGPEVKQFQESLKTYLNVKHVIPCANGTDALQIAIMALELEPGDEIIVPAFTYVATAEAIALLGFKPVMVDVNPNTFNIDTSGIMKAITARTKAIIPVHLYGQSANMEVIMQLAKEHDLYVIEDNAQALGAEYIFADGTRKKTGTIGHIGCNSFFPTKNLGCFGDGGAISTNDDRLAEKCRIIASHGQKKKYYHSVVGCNSRLDTIQAAILNIKLKYLPEYLQARQHVALFYENAFKNISEFECPQRDPNAIHTFNQFTIKIKNGERDKVKQYLEVHNIPSIIYYPLPLYRQEAFQKYSSPDFRLENTEQLCDSVLSLPMHTELNEETLKYITQTLKKYYE